MQALVYIANLLRFCMDYGNPMEIFAHRWLYPKGCLRLTDRASGMNFECKAASYQMFGEVWHDHDYDVPRIPIRTGDVVIDIGANQGFYACYAAKFGAQVLAFEPVPELFQFLKRNVKENGLAKQVTTLCCGVADDPGEVEMVLSDYLGGGMNTIVAQFARRHRLEVSGRIQVAVTNFPTILAEHKLDRVRVCKLDCEGAEFMILEKIDAGIAKKVDAFVIEYHYRAGYGVQDLIQVLLNWGTHQVSYAEDKFCERMIIRAVRTDLLTEDGILPRLAQKQLVIVDKSFR